MLEEEVEQLLEDYIDHLQIFMDNPLNFVSLREMDKIEAKLAKSGVYIDKEEYLDETSSDS